MLTLQSLDLKKVFLFHSFWLGAAQNGSGAAFKPFNGRGNPDST